MKFRLLYPIMLTILCAVVLLGNKNGRASEAKVGNTGAPGDEALANGTPLTCISCHTASPITASMTVQIFDADSNIVTQYIPGDDYIARVTITAVTGNPLGYGFQMIALRDADTTDLDGFSDPGNFMVNNYKIATIPNGRTYAEHDNVSNSNIFNVKWKAPVAGTGNVTFYAAGNAVNKNGQNNGDGASFTTLQLTESVGAATQNPDAAGIGLQVWPNPVATDVQLRFQLNQAGRYQFAVRDLSGRLVYQATKDLPAGENQVAMPANSWQAGVYFGSISGGGLLAGFKVVKL